MTNSESPTPHALPPEQKTGIHAVAYLRVSTDRQELGLQAQRDAIERYCAAQHVQVVAEYVDEGISGGAPLDKRPGLLRAVEALRPKHVTRLVVARRDRLARDVVTSALTERFARNHGAAIVCADGAGNGDTPEAELLRTIMDAVSQYERSLIKMRIRSALDVKRQRGERISRFAPYGFEFEHGMVVPSHHEQLVLREMFDVRSRGGSYQAIADHLNEEELFKRDGSPWAQKVVWTVMRRAEKRAQERGAA